MGCAPREKSGEYWNIDLRFVFGNAVVSFFFFFSFIKKRVQGYLCRTTKVNAKAKTKNCNSLGAMTVVYVDRATLKT